MNENFKLKVSQILYKMSYIKITDINAPVPIHAGFLCTSNYLIRTILRLDLKSPFMLMRISLKDISQSISDNFATYLDRTRYYKSDAGVLHYDFPTLLWNHVDPTTNEGYEKLSEQVSVYRHIIDATEKRPIIFTCFAGYKPHNTPEIHDMIGTLESDAVLLLNTARKIYNREITILIFSDEKSIQERITKINNESIISLPLSHTIYTWGLSLHNQTESLKEIKQLYENFIGHVVNENLSHSLPLPQEFFD